MVDNNHRDVNNNNNNNNNISSGTKHSPSEEADMDRLLQPSASSSSSSDFPLPSAVSAVGTVHPCGHWFHVSCFYNHQKQQQQRQAERDTLVQKTFHKNDNKSKSKRTPKRQASIVLENGPEEHEIMLLPSNCSSFSSNSDEESVVTDEDEEDYHQKKNPPDKKHHKNQECPTCLKRGVILAEISNPFVHNNSNNSNCHSEYGGARAVWTKEKGSVGTVISTNRVAVPIGRTHINDKSLLAHDTLSSSYSHSGDDYDGDFDDDEDDDGDSDDDDDDQHEKDKNNEEEEDIMNYYSFPNSDIYEDSTSTSSSNSEDSYENENDVVGSENAMTPKKNIAKSFVDATNTIMAQNLQLLSKLPSASKSTSTSKPSEQPSTATKKPSPNRLNAWLFSKQAPTSTAPNSTSTSTTQFFDARSTPATPSSTVVGGGPETKTPIAQDNSTLISSFSKHGKTSPKKTVRFFREDDDELSSPATGPMLSIASSSSTIGIPDPKVVRSNSYTQRSSSTVTETGHTNDDTNGSCMQKEDSFEKSHEVVSQHVDNEANQSFEATLSHRDESETDGMLDLADVLVLPSSDSSKMLLWNVSSHDDCENDNNDGSLVERLQEELVSLRRQLQESEEEKEEAQRVAATTRTRELDTVAQQAHEILDLKKTLQNHQEREQRNQLEIIAAEGELATAQMQLETATESHEQVEVKLRGALSQTQKELEEAKRQVEKYQEELYMRSKDCEDEREARKQDYETTPQQTQSQLERSKPHAVLPETRQDEEAKLISVTFELVKQQLLNQTLDARSKQAINDLKAAKAVLEKAQSINSELEEQKLINQELASRLNETKEQLKLATDLSTGQRELLTVDEGEDMGAIREELDFTRTGMEQLLGIMQNSEKELGWLREELTAAKEALSSSTSNIDLKRISTSTSSMCTAISTCDQNTVHSLREELAEVKKELSDKNAFIQGQLTLAKGNLMDYVRTKEAELEDTKDELSKTKQALDENNEVITKELQETEQELHELSCMKETLMSTMNDLEGKNNLITKQLDEAKEQLALLADTRKELKGTKQALSATNLKLWSTFAVIAVFMGQCAKNKFFPLKDKADETQTGICAHYQSEFDEFTS